MAQPFTDKKQEEILSKLIKNKLNPLQDAGLKAVVKMQDKQIEEAMGQGVPAEDVLRNLSIPINKNEASQNVDNDGAPFQSPDVAVNTPKGILRNLFQQAGISMGEDGKINVKQGGAFSVRARNQLPNAKILQELLGGGQLDFDRQQEDRRERKEGRLLELSEGKQINDFGRIYDPDDAESVKVMQELGIDPDEMILNGKAERKASGKIFIKPKKSRDRIEGEKSVPQSVQTAMAEFKDTRDILKDSVNEFNRLGLDKVMQDATLIEQMFKEAGPLSVSAKSNLLRQFQDPKVAALFDKLERAFQKYRIKTTGVQASDKELARLRPLIFNLSQNPAVFLDNANDILRELDQSASNRIKMMEAGGKDPKVVEGLRNLYSDGQDPIPEFSDTNPPPMTPAGEFNLNNVLEGL